MRSSSRPSAIVLRYVSGGSPPVMSTGLPAAPNGGMNFMNAPLRASGISINFKPLLKLASDSSTPVPPARLPPPRLAEDVVVHLVVARERRRVRGRRLGACRRGAGLEDHDRLLLRDALRDLDERAPVLEVLHVQRDAVRGVVLLEERQQVVLVDVGLVAEAHDRG